MGDLFLKRTPFCSPEKSSNQSWVFPIFRSDIMAGAIARPTGMKGHLMKTIQSNLGLATVFASVVTTGWYFWVVKSRKDAYANFYKNLDADAILSDRNRKESFITTKIWMKSKVIRRKHKY